MGINTPIGPPTWNLNPTVCEKGVFQWHLGGPTFDCQP